MSFIEGDLNSSFEQLAATAPELSVDRDGSGQVTISKTYPEEGLLKIILDVITEENGLDTQPYLQCATDWFLHQEKFRSFSFTLRRGGSHQFDCITDSQTQPEEIVEVLTTSEQGLELLKAFQSCSGEVKKRYRDRIQDEWDQSALEKVQPLFGKTSYALMILKALRSGLPS